MTDAKTYIQKHAEFNPIRESLIREAVRILKLPKGSRGLDAGCGIGLQAMLLAEEIGPSGHVTGLDISSDLLQYARESSETSELSKCVSFEEGDVNNLPFENDTFDWVWSADCVGYPTAVTPVCLLKELARVVKPGGRVAILGYSSQQLLPGYPFLEARLNATCLSHAPLLKGKSPEQNFLCALGWFHELGFEDSAPYTLVKDMSAPLSEEIRVALVSLFDMLWGTKSSEVREDDWEEFERLCLPESPDFILNRPDYYAFYTYSMFTGRVPY
ncbi:MAG: class I SAM-dependent methyltransferase [Candidatus Aminicenantes bacterium]|jgi:demethylmenaquinone methyltransferase/2-methoxy-6-polyprenyl-1,4-benzoquinol methylase